MSDIDWDQFDSDFIKFDEIGDSVAGTIMAIRVGKDFKGNPCPELVVRTDNGDKTVTAGQAKLKPELARLKPQVGDRIAIVYSADGDAKPGQAPAKLFDVQVQKVDTAAAGASSGPSASELL